MIVKGEYNVHFSDCVSIQLLSSFTIVVLYAFTFFVTLILLTFTQMSHFLFSLQ